MAELSLWFIRKLYFERQGIHSIHAIIIIINKIKEIYKWGVIWRLYPVFYGYPVSKTGITFGINGLALP